MLSNVEKERITQNMKKNKIKKKVWGLYWTAILQHQTKYMSND